MLAELIGKLRKNRIVCFDFLQSLIDLVLGHLKLTIEVLLALLVLYGFTILVDIGLGFNDDLDELNHTRHAQVSLLPENEPNEVIEKLSHMAKVINLLI